MSSSPNKSTLSDVGNLSRSHLDFSRDYVTTAVDTLGGGTMNSVPTLVGTTRSTRSRSRSATDNIRDIDTDVQRGETVVRGEEVMDPNPAVDTTVNTLIPAGVNPHSLVMEDDEINLNLNISNESGKSNNTYLLDKSNQYLDKSNGYLADIIPNLLDRSGTGGNIQNISGMSGVDVTMPQLHYPEGLGLEDDVVYDDNHLNNTSGAISDLVDPRPNDNLANLEQQLSTLDKALKDAESAALDMEGEITVDQDLLKNTKNLQKNTGVGTGSIQKSLLMDTRSDLLNSSGVDLNRLLATFPGFPNEEGGTGRGSVKSPLKKGNTPTTRVSTTKPLVLKNCT